MEDTIYAMRNFAYSELFGSEKADLLDFLARMERADAGTKEEMLRSLDDVYDVANIAKDY